MPMTIRDLMTLGFAIEYNPLAKEYYITNNNCSVESESVYIVLDDEFEARDEIDKENGLGLVQWLVDGIKKLNHEITVLGLISKELKGENKQCQNTQKK